ncbi:hypothetical protein CAPTEDRAFT_203909 [Capitella teleta]|uniref:Uncharacterized protein n=1 Tax=Capitella teleta TaxID=283909 RepID=R7VBA7_CAPTE|nr:hypothetical protein CAPTEDRAFT_203909 [Capitella teleta]|eukprot:ELU13596.1 hypothetical protein CAPTEDRAFT_203909 [Capitella teleta]
MHRVPCFGSGSPESGSFPGVSVPAKITYGPGICRRILCSQEKKKLYNRFFRARHYVTPGAGEGESEGSKIIRTVKVKATGAWPKDAKDNDTLKVLFRKTFMELIYPIHSSAMLKPIIHGSSEREEERQKEISSLATFIKDKKEGVAALLSPVFTNKPFDMSEVAFQVVGPHCQVNR